MIMLLSDKILLITQYVDANNVILKIGRVFVGGPGTFENFNMSLTQVNGLHNIVFSWFSIS